MKYTPCGLSRYIDGYDKRVCNDARANIASSGFRFEQRQLPGIAVYNGLVQPNDQMLIFNAKKPLILWRRKNLAFPIERVTLFCQILGERQAE